MKVYRCGSLQRSAHRYTMIQACKFFDDVMPAGRVGREHAIYASPMREFLTQWILMKERRKQRRADWGPDNEFAKHDHDTLVRHLEVVQDGSLYVYDSALAMELLNRSPLTGVRGDITDGSLYWESGILLEQWLETMDDRSMNTNMDAEVLVAPRHIKSILLETTGEIEPLTFGDQKILARR